MHYKTRLASGVQTLLKDAREGSSRNAGALEDSSLLTELVRSHALLLREIDAPPAKAGDPCRIIKLRND